MVMLLVCGCILLPGISLWLFVCLFVAVLCLFVVISSIIQQEPFTGTSNGGSGMDALLNRSSRRPRDGGAGPGPVRLAL